MYIITAEKVYKYGMKMGGGLCLYKGEFDPMKDHYLGIFCRLNYDKSIHGSLYEEKPKKFRGKKHAEHVAYTMLKNEAVQHLINSSALMAAIINPKVWEVEEYLKVAAMAKLKGDRRYPVWYIP